MALKNNWVDRTNDEDFVMAEDVNQIAQAVIDVEDDLLDRLKWRGEYTADTHYDINDVVLYDGSLYVCATAIDKGEIFPPPNKEYWSLLASKGADANFSGLTSFETTADAVEIDDNGFTIKGGAILKDESGSYPLESTMRIPLVSGDGVSIDKTKTDKVVIALDSEMILQVLSNYYTKKEVEEYIDNYINSALGGDY